MNQEKFIKEHWSEIKVKIKERYPQLTEGDLRYEEGYESEFFKNLQMKLGKTDKELETELIALNTQE